MQKCFSNKFVKNDVFENSKYACFHCNQNGHFIYSCPFKNKTYFEAKLIWVPKINPQGPEIKRVPKIILFYLVGTNTRAMYLIYCGTQKYIGKHSRK